MGKYFIRTTLIALAAAPFGLRAQEDTSAPLPITANVPDLSAEFIEDTPLFLAVKINGNDIGLIAEFTAHPTENRISIQRKELGEIGVRAPTGLRGRIFLDTLKGLHYSYDQSAQTIHITAAHAALLPTVSSAAQRPEYLEPERETGAVLNYSLATELGGSQTRSGVGFNAVSATLDGWVYAPFGTLSSTGFYRYFNTADANGIFTRQETRFEFYKPDRALTFAVGDITSSSLPWSRAIRMGGVQMRRDFSLRSDLVTDQLLAFSGAAAVPSTVDVFIDNNRAYSTQINEGPFQIEDVPLYHGSGEAEIVIRGRDGTEKRRNVSFFSSQNLIKKGVADYSIETGVARESYGVESNEYGTDGIISATMRYGATETLTLLGHAEAKSDLTMFGVGFAAVPYALGEVTLTAGGSKYQAQTAGFVHGTLRTSIGAVDLSISSTRAQPGFADLALATGVDFLGAGQVATGSLLEFPEELDVVSLAIPVSNDGRKLGLSYINSRRATSNDQIVSASFGHSLKKGRGSLNVSAAHNLVADETRVAMGLSMSLGKRRHARAALNRDGAGRTSTSLFVSKSKTEKIGSYGYDLQLDRRNSQLNLRARGDYRSRYAEYALEVQQAGSDTYLRGQMDGALVYSGGKITAGNAITDSFAMVDVGVADVPIYLQNREVARTSRAGRAIVPGLSSFRRNRVSINVAELPADAFVGVTAMDVVPDRRAGNFVDFAGSSTQAALVVLRLADGRFVPAGSTVKVNGSGQEFTVGYDGEAWLENIKGSNRISVDTGAGRCTASFNYAASADLQDVVDGVVCS